MSAHHKCSWVYYPFKCWGQPLTSRVNTDLHLTVRKLFFRSIHWCILASLMPRCKTRSILTSSWGNPVHIGGTADQLLLDQKFLTDIKFDSDYLVFPGISQLLHSYLMTINVIFIGYMCLSCYHCFFVFLFYSEIKNSGPRLKIPIKGKLCLRQESNLHLFPHQEKRFLSQSMLLPAKQQRPI